MMDDVVGLSGHERHVESDLCGLKGDDDFGADTGPPQGDRCRRAIRPTGAFMAAACYVCNRRSQTLDQLTALSSPGESYSDVILRLAKG